MQKRLKKSRGLGGVQGFRLAVGIRGNLKCQFTKVTANKGGRQYWSPCPFIAIQICEFDFLPRNYNTEHEGLFREIFSAHPLSQYQNLWTMCPFQGIWNDLKVILLLVL